MYLPFLSEPRMVAMGLKPLDPSRWIEPDEEWAEFHEHKLKCFETRRNISLLATDRSKPAQEELKTYLREHLLRDHPSTFNEGPRGLSHTPTSTTILPKTGSPIEEAALWVQDDLCLMEDSPEGYRLTAAALCSPSFWHLEEKIGKTLDQIHLPVPNYTEELSHPTRRFFKKLKDGKPFWRMNWTVVSNPQLMQRHEFSPKDDLDLAPLWLRVERQTLLRLPQTQSICFTIRIHRTLLEDALSTPEAKEAFHTALQQLKPDELTYKSLSPLRHRLGLSLS